MCSVVSIFASQGGENTQKRTPGAHGVEKHLTRWVAVTDNKGEGTWVQY